MAKSDAWENQLLLHLLQNADVTLIGDAGGLRGSVAAGSLYVSLHTSDPGEAGTQATNESAYGGYARAAVARSAGGWTVTAGAAENAGVVTFPACSSGSSTVTHFGVGTDASGAGKLLYHGALSASLAVSVGITPQFAAGALDLTES